MEICLWITEEKSEEEKYCRQKIHEYAEKEDTASAWENTYWTAEDESKIQKLCQLRVIACAEREGR